jgi:Protein kinase domain
MADEQHVTGRELCNGRFVVTRTLGRGAQAATLEAVDKANGRLVALKCFVVRTAQSWKDVELAEREAKVLSELQHPLLPQYVTHFEEGGSLYLAMELIEGRPVQELRGGGRLSQSEVVALLKDTAATLDYLHSRSPPIIHRDIKPRNIIRRADGRFVLVDFGSVRDKLQPEGGSTVVGTFGYMAPEQFQGRAMPASDTYAAAATALSLLTGEEPERLPHKGLALDVTRALAGSTDPQLESLLKSALDPDPDKRSALSLSALLKKYGFLDAATSSGSSRSKESPAADNFRNAAATARERVERAVRNPKRRERVYEQHERREGAQGFSGARADAWQRPGVTEAYARAKPGDIASASSFQRVPPPIWLGLVVLFTLIRVLLGVGLRVVVPVLLNVLAVFAFGPDLRRAALRVREVGKDAQRELRGAQARLVLGSGKHTRIADKAARISVIGDEVDSAVDEAERNVFRP